MACSWCGSICWAKRTSASLCSGLISDASTAGAGAPPDPVVDVSAPPQADRARTAARPPPRTATRERAFMVKLLHYGFGCVFVPLVHRSSGAQRLLHPHHAEGDPTPAGR